jgi:isoquinoline 1-oxidoreductase alpha subunit
LRYHDPRPVERRSNAPGSPAIISLTLNGRPVELDVAPETPLLWVIREQAGLTGTKFGCGIGACGACTVHIDGTARRSCVVPLSAVAGRSVTTIEATASATMQSIRQAWLEHQVPQCGYCQSGMIMAVAALLESNPRPSDEQIDSAVTNLCRCGTYERIRRAVHSAAERLGVTNA